jgi:hypothetical protein
VIWSGSESSDQLFLFLFVANVAKNTTRCNSAITMSSISRSITQTIVPAVRRAASTAAPAATQSAKEGFKLVEVCPLFSSLGSTDRSLLHSLAHKGTQIKSVRLTSVFQVLYAVPPLLAIVGYGGTVCFHETGALRRIRRSFAEVPH